MPVMIDPKQMQGGKGAVGNVFGNGSLGNITLSVNTPNFVGGDYESLTIAPGITVTPPLNRSIRIRCRTLFHMGAGAVIDASTSWQGFGVNPSPSLVIQTGSMVNAAPGGPGGGGASAFSEGQSGNQQGGGGGGGAEIGYAFGNGGTFGSFGSGGVAPNGVGGSGTDATPGAPGAVDPDFLAATEVGGMDFVSSGAPGGIGVQGSQGGQGGFGVGPGGNGGNGGPGGLGGNGGGLIRIEAAMMQFDAGASLFTRGGPGGAGGPGQPGQAAAAASSGGGGGAGSGGGGGQGGGGGPILLRYQTLLGAPTTDVSGGVGSAGGAGAAGGAGDGGAGAGGASGKGADGALGSTGYVKSIQL